MDGVRCLFDANEPKVLQSFSLSSTLSINYICAADNDPQALQSGIYLWPASSALCKYLYAKRLRFASPKRIIELGAGVGLVGICLGKIYPNCQITLTDRDQIVLDVIDQNIKLNKLSDQIRSCPLRWGETSEELEDLTNEETPVDLIIGSDLVYATWICDKLFSTVSYLLRKSRRRGLNDAQFFLCSSFRHPETTEIIETICDKLKLKRCELTNSLDEGGVIIEAYKLI